MRLVLVHKQHEVGGIYDSDDCVETQLTSQFCAAMTC